MQNTVDSVVTIRETLGIAGIDAAVVLGSGWAALLDEWHVSARMSYAEAGLRPPVAPGHAGELALVENDGRKILVFSGRTHLYEGHGAHAVGDNVRVAAALGAQVVVLTNANGSFVHEWPLGQIVALSDHINLTGTSPLLGADFVDLTNAYDAELRDSFVAEAQNTGVRIETGVYAMFSGPHFETAAEARMAALLGAHVCGMSTVLETIASRGVDMRVLALSTVTAHEASGDVIDPDEVIAIAETQAGRVAPAVMSTLMKAL